MKKVMLPVKEVDLTAVKYDREQIQAERITTLASNSNLRRRSRLKKKRKMIEVLRNTVIPDVPMFIPEFPPQEPELGVVVVEEAGRPKERVAAALNCLPVYDAATCWDDDLTASFRYWKIRDFANAYRTRLATPSMVAEQIISALEDFKKSNPVTPFLISYDAEDVRKQAAISTQRFDEGNPISILDGIFMAIKDDIDCYPHPSKGATTWFHEVRPVKEDAVSVSRLRSCGVILIGKANMHELGLGITGDNPHYGTARNPHAFNRYPGGSSSGSAAIVASGLCSAALGTDGGGSIRIPSSLCGVVGLKTTYGWIDMKGSLCNAGTVQIIGPIASTVEDVMLVYAAIVGSSSADRISLKPPPPCFPNLSTPDSFRDLDSVRLGKYTEWFNDVYSREISEKCEDVLNLVSKIHGCQILEIIIPELQEMRIAHSVSIGSEALCSLNPHYGDGKGLKLAYDTRTMLAFFGSFTAADYVAAQCLRRRLMYYHMEIFKKVDIIVAPTTGMTAPFIPSSDPEAKSTNSHVSGYLMRFVIAANLLGLPAISLPVGYDKQGLPIGLQLIGRPWGEASILRAASAIEEICQESKRRPGLYYDILKGN
ncbi:hypothetical protein Nepgr_027981 [Nepenthes gracilis]|uniref:Amidase domain-containing protein n=1 Tax=Nepenthes gracilis TaxID=150966 RepID=A0AAD3TBH9_NEPGR|nr:hypothetical protein Nepgr_027981 [Nepenthes gracilis]